MVDSVNLSSATRTNLLALQSTTDLIGRTQERLSTGLKVNSAIDDAIAFFQASSLSDRASDLSTLKDDVDQGIIPTDVIHDTLAHFRRVMEASRSGMVRRSFQAMQQASTMAS